MRIQETLQGPPPPETLARRQTAQALAPHIRAFYQNWQLPTGPQHHLRNAAQ